MEKKLIIVDISSFIFRAFYAIRSLTGPDGTPVNAVHGTLSMILKLLSQYRPTHIVLARDLPGGTFRNEIFPEYKAHRSAPPEELVEQFPLIDAMIEKMGIPTIAIAGYEADDIIASIAVQWKDRFDQVLIATGDKDLMQLVDDKVRILDTMKDIIYDAEAVYEKMGVYPNQIVDYLSIIGDTSDNIPGMKGIGAKGASKILGEYGSLDECVKNSDKFSNKRVKDAFINHLEDGYLSRKLIEIVKDLDLKKDVVDLEFKFYPSNQLVEFLTNLGLKNLVSKIKDLAYIDDKVEIQDEKLKVAISDRTALKVVTVDEKTLEATLKEISSEKRISIYPLWNSYSIEDRFNRELMALSVGISDGRVYNFHFKNSSLNLLEQEQSVLEVNAIEQVWKTIFANKKIKVAAHDWKQFFSYGMTSGFDDVLCDYFDISVAHYCLEPSLKHDLDYISNIMLGYGPIDFDPKKIAELDFSATSEIIAQRAGIVASLQEVMEKEIELKKLNKPYYEIDIPLIPILAKMENKGVHLNVAYFDELEEKFSKEIEEIEEKISKLVDGPINLRSPKQVAHLLYEVLELPVIKKTKTGNSTNSDVLQELDAYYDSEIPGLILQYREVDKLLSTYVKSFPKYINNKTKRLHTNFNQIMAATGRLSSEHPNLQNIPVRTESGRLLRKGFIATPGNILLSADYSQVELRIVAHMSEDDVMIDAFNHDLDIHAQTAAEIFHVELSKVTREQRAAAKAVNFGLIYGQSSFGLSQSLHISRKDAQEYIQAYFKNFHRVKSFLDSLKEDCERTGHAETMFGRKRILEDINSSNRTMKSMAERIAINSPIQGTASDIIKIAMISIDQQLSDKKLRSKMILQVHDELIFDVFEEELEQLKLIVKGSMETAIELKVPLKVDMAIGVNWFDLK